MIYTKLMHRLHYEKFTFSNLFCEFKFSMSLGCRMELKTQDTKKTRENNFFFLGVCVYVGWVSGGGGGSWGAIMKLIWESES